MNRLEIVKELFHGALNKAVVTVNQDRFAYNNECDFCKTTIPAYEIEPEGDVKSDIVDCKECGRSLCPLCYDDHMTTEGDHVRYF